MDKMYDTLRGHECSVIHDWEVIQPPRVDEEKNTIECGTAICRKCGKRKLYWGADLCRQRST